MCVTRRKEQGLVASGEGEVVEGREEEVEKRDSPDSRFRYCC